MIWQTLTGDDVTKGDVVALGILGNPDAVGLIVGPGADGRVECLLGDHDNPHGERPTLQVEAYQLRMLLRKGVTPKVLSDYTRQATPVVRDPETEAEDGGETTDKDNEPAETLAA